MDDRFYYYKENGERKIKIGKLLVYIAMWVMSSFMLISGFVFLPSIASIMMFLFAVIALPNDKWQTILKERKITGPLKTAILVVLFFAAVFLAK